jgi:hypothetical protein
VVIVNVEEFLNARGVHMLQNDRPPVSRRRVRLQDVLYQVDFVESATQEAA